MWSVAIMVLGEVSRHDGRRFVVDDFSFYRVYCHVRIFGVFVFRDSRLICSCFFSCDICSCHYMNEVLFFSLAGWLCLCCVLVC